MKIETISSSYHNDGIFSFFRSSSPLNSASYRVSYSFSDDLIGQWRTFAGWSICLTTNPYADMRHYYNDRFYIKLVKRGWFNKEIDTYMARVNEWQQFFKWNGIEAGDYRLEFSKYDKYWEWSYVYFRDDKFPTALFQNCNHW